MGGRTGGKAGEGGKGKGGNLLLRRGGRGERGKGRKG